jgi:hypothetical protein
LPDATALGRPHSMDRKCLAVEFDQLSGDLRLCCWLFVALTGVLIVAMAGVLTKIVQKLPACRCCIGHLLSGAPVIIIQTKGR